MIKKETQNTIKNLGMVIVIFILMVACDTLAKQQKTIDELTNIISDMVEIEKKQTNEIEELWKNIDALSIDYTQIYNEIYKEVE